MAGWLLTSAQVGMHESQGCIGIDQVACVQRMLAPVSCLSPLIPCSPRQAFTAACLLENTSQQFYARQTHEDRLIGMSIDKGLSVGNLSIITPSVTNL